MRASNGESRMRPAAAAVTSMKRFRKPENPRRDLCGLALAAASFRFFFDPLGDEFPKSDLEVFTRKYLHLTPNLIHRPRHRFQSADRTDDVIHVLLREKNPIDPILSCL